MLGSSQSPHLPLRFTLVVLFLPGNAVLSGDSLISMSRQYFGEEEVGVPS